MHLVQVQILVLCCQIALTGGPARSVLFALRTRIRAMPLTETHTPRRDRGEGRWWGLAKAECHLLNTGGMKELCGRRTMASKAHRGARTGAHLSKWLRQVKLVANGISSRWGHCDGRKGVQSLGGFCGVLTGVGELEPVQRGRSRRRASERDSCSSSRSSRSSSRRPLGDRPDTMPVIV